MRQLVSNHRSDTLLLLGARTALIDQEIDFAVGDNAPILHSTGGELRDRDHVQLRERIGGLKVVVVKIERFDRDVERESALLGFAGGGIAPHSDSVACRRLDEIEFSDDKAEKISRHLQRRQRSHVNPYNSRFG